MYGWGLPAVIVAILAWLNAAPVTIGELAQREALRRTLVAKSSRSYSNNDLLAFSTPFATPTTAATAPPDAPPASADPASPAPAAPPVDPPHDESWWSNRMAQARGALQRDTLLSEAVQSRINALTSDAVSRDDPAQKAQVDYGRRQALGELDRLTKALESDKKAIADIEEDARRQGVPPGWIR